MVSDRPQLRLARNDEVGENPPALETGWAPVNGAEDDLPIAPIPEVISRNGSGRFPDVTTEAEQPAIDGASSSNILSCGRRSSDESLIPDRVQYVNPDYQLAWERAQYPPIWSAGSFDSYMNSGYSLVTQTAFPGDGALLSEQLGREIGSPGGDIYDLGRYEPRTSGLGLTQLTTLRAAVRPEAPNCPQGISPTLLQFDPDDSLQLSPTPPPQCPPPMGLTAGDQPKRKAEGKGKESPASKRRKLAASISSEDEDGDEHINVDDEGDEEHGLSNSTKKTVCIQQVGLAGNSTYRGPRNGSTPKASPRDKAPRTNKQANTPMGPGQRRVQISATRQSLARIIASRSNERFRSSGVPSRDSTHQQASLGLNTSNGASTSTLNNTPSTSNFPPTGIPPAQPIPDNPIDLGPIVPIAQRRHAVFASNHSEPGDFGPTNNSVGDSRSHVLYTAYMMQNVRPEWFTPPGMIFTRYETLIWCLSAQLWDGPRISRLFANSCFAARPKNGNRVNRDLGELRRSGRHNERAEPWMEGGFSITTMHSHWRRFDRTGEVTKHPDYRSPDRLVREALDAGRNLLRLPPQVANLPPPPNSLLSQTLHNPFRYYYTSCYGEILTYEEVVKLPSAFEGMDVEQPSEPTIYPRKNESRKKDIQSTAAKVSTSIKCKMTDSFKCKVTNTVKWEITGRKSKSKKQQEPLVDQELSEEELLNLAWDQAQGAEAVAHSLSGPLQTSIPPSNRPSDPQQGPVPANYRRQQRQEGISHQQNDDMLASNGDILCRE